MNGRVKYVLDSTALIALIGSEPGSDKIAAVLDQSTMSAVNFTETIHKLVQRGSDPSTVERLLAQLQINITDWTEDLSYRSADFAALGRSHGLSLGDRACLTLAKFLHATAVTSDRAWREASHLGVRIEIFR